MRYFEINPVRADMVAHPRDYPWCEAVTRFALMEFKWTGKALSDLARLYEFLASVNRDVEARTVQSLTAAPARLLANPRIGEKLEEFELREVRRILVGH